MSFCLLLPVKGRSQFARRLKGRKMHRPWARGMNSTSLQRCHQQILLSEAVATKVHTDSGSDRLRLCYSFSEFQADNDEKKKLVTKELELAISVIFFFHNEEFDFNVFCCRFWFHASAFGKQRLWNQKGFNRQINLLNCLLLVRNNFWRCKYPGSSLVFYLKVHSYTAAFCGCGMRFAVAENFFVRQIWWCVHIDHFWRMKRAACDTRHELCRNDETLALASMDAFI